MFSAQSLDSETYDSEFDDCEAECNDSREETVDYSYY